jgi:hypothetical protein
MTRTLEIALTVGVLGIVSACVGFILAEGLSGGAVTCLEAQEGGGRGAPALCVGATGASPRPPFEPGTTSDCGVAGCGPLSGASSRSTSNDGTT